MEEGLEIKGAGMAVEGQGKVSIQEIPLNKIKLGRNSRLISTNEDLSGMMESIKSTGLLEPIGVVKAGSHYEIAYGNRRFMAFSRLGYNSIPAVVHDGRQKREIDIKNLTENVQRRQLSIQEVGRYAKLIKQEGLSNKEIAIRLGTPVHYVETCLAAYKDVPREFRDDLESQYNSKKLTPGKIPINIARVIISTARAYNIGNEMKKELFKAARDDERFSANNIPKYIAAIKRGVKDPIGTVSPVRTLTFKFMVDQKEYDDLMAKHITDGPFNSMHALVKAILKGKKAAHINIID